MTEPALDRDAITDLLRREFPQIRIGEDYIVDSVGPLAASLRLVANSSHLRPGGTISGPSLFALADLALYIAILAQIGPVALAVTTSVTINFLRKPEPADLIGHAKLLKLGARLAVGEVSIFSTLGPDMVAHVTGTYSIPPRAKS